MPRSSPLILIADDNDDDRNLLRRWLERAHYSVIEAANGAEAVERTLAWRPDLVVMDLSMPVVDGLEAWRIIGEMVTPAPRAIALSAVMLNDLRLICAEAGFEALNSKPIDAGVLLEQIRLLCAGSPAQTA